MKTSIGQGGRIVIPAPYRKALGLKTGVEVIVRLEMGELRIYTPAQVLQHAQGLVRRYVPQERSLARELIAERRQEAHSE